MPTPDYPDIPYDDYLSLDRKLVLAHQQFITDRLKQNEILLVQHDQEIMILATMVIGLAILLMYTNVKVGRVMNGQPKEANPRIRSISTRAD